MTQSRSRTRRVAEATIWRQAFLAAAALSAVVYLVNVAVSEVSIGNAWSLAYGIGAAVVMLGTALFSARRRTMRVSTRLGLGRTRSWLHFHIYGGILFLLLMLMHTGFHLPTGGLTSSLWALSLWTAASGFFGLVLQKWIPRTLSSGLGTEIHYDRIPDLVGEVREQAKTLVATCDESVRTLYERKIAPELEGPTRPIPVLGAASASAIGGRKSVAHYHLIEIETKTGQAQFTVQHYHYDKVAGSFSLTNKQTL